MKILLIYIAFIFFSNHALSQEFKVDLSTQIKNSIQNKVIDASEKKKAALLFYKLTSEIDNLNISDLLETRINSVEYVSGKLIIKYSLVIKDSAEKLIEKNIAELIKINFSSLTNKLATKDQIYEINSKSTKHFVTYLMAKKSRDIQLYVPVINAIDSSGVILTKFNNLDEQSIQYARKTLIDKSEVNIEIKAESQYTDVFELSPSIASKIKNFKFELIENDFPEKSKIKSGSDELNKSSINLLSTLNSKNIIEDFQINREIALGKLLTTAKFFLGDRNKTYVPNFVHFIHLIHLVDHIIFYSIIERDMDSSILQYEFEDVFQFDTMSQYLNGRKKYKFQYSNASKTGCDAFIPDNYQYNNPSSVFGVNPTKEVNALMSQLGMINDSTVSGLPDGKIRVISGKISALTNDGGIIYNNSQYGDAKPIKYTLSNKSKIINQADIKLDSVLVRIVGTYNQNTKIQLRNNVGGSRNVDAVNLDVLCIEPIASDQDLMKILFNR
jgi:hypothetical protein